MKSDLYRLATVKDVKTDTTSIIKVFSDMAEGRVKSDIRLLNYYQEVPVTYPSTIKSVDTDSVELSVHEHQAILMKHDNSTLVTSSHFHKEYGVHCYAAYVSVAKKIVILHNFSYAQIRAARREAVRVSVKDNISATFSYDNILIEGKMLDISGTGISILSFEVPATETDQPGLLTFTLMGTLLTVHGAFVRAIANGVDGQICIFKTKLDRAGDNVVGKFVYQRQIEIIQELKDGLIEE